MLLLKRYPNRKLYNTHTSQYLTLDEIAVLVRNDVDVKVIDSESGDEITALILAQVIMGQEKSGSCNIPHEILSGLIKAKTEHLEVLRQVLVNSAEWWPIMSNYSAPTRQDIQRLDKQIDRLSKLIDELISTS